MIANYHSHTTRCNHAKGTEREYVEQAIAHGLKILGFSDHTPYIFPNTDYYSHFRMKLHELDEYIHTILTLKEEYKNDIQIHLGLEVEYYPKLFPTLLKELKNYPVEYMILGQHFLNNEIQAPYTGAETKDPVRMDQYCDQVIEAMETGCFSYFCHPDLFRFTGEEGVFQAGFQKICAASKRLDVPLELNLLGIREHRHYPLEKLWKLIGEEACDVVLGSDAHEPEVVYDAQSLKTAKEWIERYHLHVKDTITFKDPFAFLNK